MKRIQITCGLLLAITIATPLHAQISAFTYQGQLNLNGAPANGHYDFMFRLLNEPTNGAAAPVIPINLAVPVSNGLFTTGMDFGAENLTGANRWLEINVRTNGGGPFTTLSPRQVLTPAPYAIAAQTASNLLGALPAGQISGTILNVSLPASPSFSGTVTANNFSGNGAGLTDVNADMLDGLNSSNFWRMAGNAGTTAGTHFLGTIDNQPLELRANDQRGLRLEPGGSNSVNVIGGWAGNTIAQGVAGAIIAGGGAGDWDGSAFANRVEADFGAVLGGLINTIQPNASSSTIGGGEYNTIQAAAANAVIGGGIGNTIQTNALRATIAGGSANTIQTDAVVSTIGGGEVNTIQADAGFATIGGGYSNEVGASSGGCVIAGGSNNGIADNTGVATIAGGDSNNIGRGSSSSVIAGGHANSIAENADYAMIAGGLANRIAGGAAFPPSAEANAIGGGSRNTIEANSEFATVSGGQQNTIGTNTHANVIGGGDNNRIGPKTFGSIISGGLLNTISNDAGLSVISGGQINQIGTNTSSASIGGGSLNTITPNASFATIPGGEANTATNGAFAAGRYAKAIHTGAFVWADFGLSQIGPIEIASTNANSVTMRASGGYRLFTDFNATTGAYLASGSGSWTSMSDRNAKENFRAIDARAVLEKVVALPVQTWNYKSQEADIRHIGPMAQDFKAAFGVGESDTGIATVDADGVALAAIQGLNRKLEETRAENAELKERLVELERAVQKLGIKD